MIINNTIVSKKITKDLTCNYKNTTFVSETMGIKPRLKTDVMKNTVLQITRAYINDNKQYISGNIAEHLVTNADNMENGYYEYLTEEEIQEYEMNADMKAHYEECVVNFCYENFDYNIKKFEY